MVSEVAFLVLVFATVNKFFFFFFYLFLLHLFLSSTLFKVLLFVFVFFVFFFFFLFLPFYISVYTDFLIIQFISRLQNISVYIQT